MLIYVKLTYILFIYLKIYVLRYIIFMLFVYLLINCVILKLRNIEYEFNTKYLNTIILY